MIHAIITLIKHVNYEGIMNSYLNLKRVVYIVALAAISIVLGLFEIPWFVLSGPFASFLRLDFSEVAILVALVTLGYKDTMIVVVLRSLVRLTFKGFIPEHLIGDMIAIIASISIILGFYLAAKITKKYHKPYIVEVPSEKQVITKKDYVIYGILITTSLSIAMIILNFFITTPLLLSYYGLTERLTFHVFDFVQLTDYSISTFLWAVIISYTPFNIVKGLSVMLIFLLIWPRLKYIEY
jgi:riboflavin transporter FmnP